MTRHFALGTLAILLVGCGMNEDPTSAGNPESASIAPISAASVRMARQNGKQMRIRMTRKLKDGSTVLLGSSAVELKYEASKGRLVIKKRFDPGCLAPTTNVGLGVELVGSCRSGNQVWNPNDTIPDPTEEPEIVESFGSMFTESANNDPPASIPALHADSILIQSYNLADSFSTSSYGGGGLTTLDVATSGQVIGGVLTVSNGWEAGFTTSYTGDDLSSISITIFDGDEFETTIVITPEDISYLKDQALLSSGSNMTSVCGEKYMSAVGSVAVWGATVYIAGRVAPRTAGSGYTWVKSATGAVYTAPARQSIGKLAWGVISATATVIAGVWENMHNKIQDAIHCDD